MQLENLIFKPAMFKLVVPFTEKYNYKYNYTAIKAASPSCWCHQLQNEISYKILKYK